MCIHQFAYIISFFSVADYQVDLPICQPPVAYDNFLLESHLFDLKRKKERLNQMKWRKVRLNYAKAPFPLRLFSIGMKKIQPNSNLNDSFKGKYEFLNYFLMLLRSHL